MGISEETIENNENAAKRAYATLQRPFTPRHLLSPTKCGNDRLAIRIREHPVAAGCFQLFSSQHERSSCSCLLSNDNASRRLGVPHRQAPGLQQTAGDNPDFREGGAGMETIEKIPVYIKIINGKTVCVCHAGARKCKDPSCTRDVVTRDKFIGWRQTMGRDKFGR